MADNPDWEWINANRRLMSLRRAAGSSAPFSQAALAIALENGFAASSPPTAVVTAVFPTPPHEDTPDPVQTAVLPECVKIYPSVMVAFLNQHEAPAARVYLLLRAIDKNAAGWLEIDQVRRIATTEGKDTFMFTWRRLRQILQAGDGRFWDLTSNGRIRYRSPEKLSTVLGYGRLTGKPVYFPTSAIVTGIKEFKAHCLAAFHAGQEETSPITRASLRAITGVSETTQREYGRLAKIQPGSNIVITSDDWSDREARQKHAWQHGRSIFRFVDVRGKQPHLERFDQVIAYKLPNSYTVNLDQAPRGRQSRINREIRRRVTKGGEPIQFERLYFQDVNAAVKAVNRGQERALFRAGRRMMPKATRPPKFAGTAVWMELGQ